MKPLFLTGYSDGFADIFWQDWLPGYTAFLAEHFELRIIRFTGETGNFGSEPYNDLCRTMIGTVAQALAENDGRVIVQSDCDMRIYRSFSLELERVTGAEGFQMATAMDRLGGEPVHCGGFIVVKSTPETREFYGKWAEASKAEGIGSVQEPFNQLLRSAPFKAMQLPETYWTCGLGDLPRLWEPGDAIPFPPENIAFMHANFTIGVRHKRALLEAVRLKYQSIFHP